jgi:uncharacterized protein YcnI
MKLSRRARAATAIAAATAISVAAAAPASAHMGLITYGTTFTANATNLIYFRVPHGCADPDAATHGNANARTNIVIVNVPATVTGVKPEQKPGWDVAVEKDPVSSRVTKITWTARTKEDALRDWTYGDFGVRATLNGVAGDVIAFESEQQCGFFEDGSVASPVLSEPWTGVNAPKLTLVSANKVTSAADLADLKGRVIALEASVNGALTSIAGLITSDSTLAARLATAESSIKSLGTGVKTLNDTARLGFISATLSSGRLNLVVDLPTTTRFTTVTVKVAGVARTSLMLNAWGDGAKTLTTAQSTGLKAGQTVQVWSGSTLVATGKVG